MDAKQDLLIDFSDCSVCFEINWNEIGEKFNFQKSLRTNNFVSKNFENYPPNAKLQHAKDEKQSYLNNQVLASYNIELIRQS